MMKLIMDNLTNLHLTKAMMKIIMHLQKKQLFFLKVLISYHVYIFTQK